MLQGKQNTWVFGASGLTGREVVNALRIAGVRTHAHLRPNSSSASHVIPIFDKIGAEVQTFEWHSDALHQAFEENPPTAVFLTLGTTRSKAKVDGQGHRAVDYRLTKMVLDLIRSGYPSTDIIYFVEKVNICCITKTIKGVIEKRILSTKIKSVELIFVTVRRAHKSIWRHT